MGPSIWHILIVALVIFLLFGSKRLPGVMEDLAKAAKSFKKGMTEDETPAPPKEIARTSSGDDAPKA